MSAADFVGAGVWGVEYVRREDAIVEVRRVRVTENGSGWLCRDESGAGTLRHYTRGQLYATRAAAEGATGHSAPCPHARGGDPAR